MLASLIPLMAVAAAGSASGLEFGYEGQWAVYPYQGVESSDLSLVEPRRGCDNPVTVAAGNPQLPLPSDYPFYGSADFPAKLFSIRQYSYRSPASLVISRDVKADKLSWYDGESNPPPRIRIEGKDRFSLMVIKGKFSANASKTYLRCPAS